MSGRQVLSESRLFHLRNVSRVHHLLLFFVVLSERRKYLSHTLLRLRARFSVHPGILILHSSSGHLPASMSTCGTRTVDGASLRELGYAGV